MRSLFEQRPPRQLASLRRIRKGVECLTKCPERIVEDPRFSNCIANFDAENVPSNVQVAVQRTSSQLHQERLIEVFAGQFLSSVAGSERRRVKNVRGVQYLYARLNRSGGAVWETVIRDKASTQQWHKLGDVGFMTPAEVLDAHVATVSAIKNGLPTPKEEAKRQAAETKKRRKNKRQVSAYRKKNPERFTPEKLRDNALWSNYRIRETEYDARLAFQGGRCGNLECRTDDPGCGRSGRFYVDHDHATGRVRGLLCKKCNSMQGYGSDDPRKLLGGVKHLLYGADDFETWLELHRKGRPNITPQRVARRRLAKERLLRIAALRRSLWLMRACARIDLERPARQDDGPLFEYARRTEIERILSRRVRGSTILCDLA